MICDFCQQNFKDEFLSREKIDNGERVIICESCKINLKETNE
jgi:predicted SprT family Zn-dependent metalloprotease